MSRQASCPGLSALTPSRFFFACDLRKARELSALYLCYIDESGTSSIPGNTSHFILAGISIPIWLWRDCDRDISEIKHKYLLDNAEIHTAWILRKYLEQDRIPNFSLLDVEQRRSQTEEQRKAELLRLQRVGNHRHYKQTRKNFTKTAAYIHLTYDERKAFITEVADCVAGWGYARLFAECVDKIHFDPLRNPYSLDELVFAQIVSRFEQYLENIGEPAKRSFGLLIHDNNETVASKHTQLMKFFHQEGTLWTDINNIIETPLFVDSELTSLVQIADLCSYSLRRYLENGERQLFDLVFQRADRKGNTVVGIRHFTKPSCDCDICVGHRRG